MVEVTFELRAARFIALALGHCATPAPSIRRLWRFSKLNGKERYAGSKGEGRQKIGVCVRDNNVY